MSKDPQTDNSKKSGATWVTGERLEKYNKARTRNLAVVGIVILSLLLIFIMPIESKQLYLRGVLLLVIVWELLRIIRGETFFQLRLEELKHTKKESDKALIRLNTLAAKHRGKNGKKTS